VTVYVDDMRMPARVGRTQANWSHLMADSRDELIAFAERLGMKRLWLQNKPSGVHFDVTDSIRARAIEAGALPIECGSDQWRRVVDEARQQYVGPGKRSRRFPTEGADR
jgi:hypothetical protein